MPDMGGMGGMPGGAPAEEPADEGPKIEETLDNVHAASGDLAATSSDVRSMVAEIEAGRGSLGALLKDEEIYDDLKETLRELKRRAGIAEEKKAVWLFRPRFTFHNHAVQKKKRNTCDCEAEG